MRHLISLWIICISNLTAVRCYTFKRKLDRFSITPILIHFITAGMFLFTALNMFWVKFSYSLVSGKWFQDAEVAFGKFNWRPKTHIPFCTKLEFHDCEILCSKQSLDHFDILSRRNQLHLPCHMSSKTMNSLPRAI